MIHNFSLLLCRSTRTSRCSYLWYFPLCVDGNEGDGRKGEKTRRWGKAYTGLWCGYRNWLVEGVSVLPKDISHTHQKKKKRRLCLVLSSLAFFTCLLARFFSFPWRAVVYDVSFPLSCLKPRIFILLLQLYFIPSPFLSFYTQTPPINFFVIIKSPFYTLIATQKRTQSRKRKWA